MHLGTAFQLIDDVLDYSDSNAAIGKNIGDDLAEGKPTLPLIHAMRVGTASQQAIIREAIDPRLIIEYLPMPADDPQQRKPDIAVAYRLLGWEPRTSFIDGLRRTIDWYFSTKDHAQIDRLIVDQLGLKTREPDLEDWRELLRRLRHPRRCGRARPRHGRPARSGRR
jgi:hypothetical protein